MTDDANKKDELYTLIAMDQRYSHVDQEDSNGEEPPCADKVDDHHNMDWTTFRDDQLALLDHLQIATPCHIVASCIGPSYALQLLRDAPTRFGKAVLLQPIGIARHTTEAQSWPGLNTGAEEHWFGDWAKVMVQTRRASSQAVMDRLHANMFGSNNQPEHNDFVFTISRPQMAQIQHPLLIFCGGDLFHPAEMAREIGRLSPNDDTQVIEEWRNAGPAKLEQAHERMLSFLKES